MCTVSALNLDGSQTSVAFRQIWIRTRTTCELDNLSSGMSSSNCSLCSSCCCNSHSQGMLSLLCTCFNQCSGWCCNCGIPFLLKPSKTPSPFLWLLRLHERNINQIEYCYCAITIRWLEQCINIVGHFLLCPLTQKWIAFSPTQTSPSALPWRFMTSFKPDSSDTILCSLSTSYTRYWTKWRE